MLSRFCNIDYDREMAFIAEYSVGETRKMAGVSRLIIEPSMNGEFAVLVGDDFQGQELGLKLTDMLIGVGLEKSLNSIYGIVLNDNVRMLGLAEKLGFSIQNISDEETRVVLQL